MRLTFNPHGALTLGFVAMTTRMFFEAAIDGARYQHAGWIAILAGCALNLPIALLLDALDARDNDISSMNKLERAVPLPLLRVFCAIVCLFSLYEAAACTRTLSGSAEYTVLAKMRINWLLVFTSLIATASCLSGGAAVCGAARIWLYMFFPLVLIVIVVQMGFYNVHWLTPIFGPGVKILARGSINFASIGTYLIPMWLCIRADHPDGEKKRPHSIVKLLGLVALAACALSILFYMLSPTMPSAPNQRTFGHDRLLNNGRVAISLQFPLVIIWHFCLITQLAANIVGCSQMLKFTIPKIKEWICVLIVGALSMVLTLVGMAEQEYFDLVYALRYPLVTAIMAAFAVVVLVKRRKKAHA